MTIAEWITEASHKIARTDAELLLLHFVFPDADRSYFIAHDNELLIPNEKLDSAVKRRAAGCPLAYLIEKREFYGRSFRVEEGKTLIPRPETEDIVDFCLDIAETSDDQLRIVDVGTGSGCIAITLAREIPNAKVDAIDISQDALEVARQNAKQLHAKVNFIEGDLLKDYHQKADIVIANLPYVDQNWEWLDHNSLSYEPAQALFADDHGLALIYELIAEFSERFNHGYLILEADPSQHARIISVATARNLELTRERNYILQFKAGA